MIDDLVTLRELSCKTYSDTLWAYMNASSNMKAYLEQAYDIGKLRDEELLGSFYT